MAAESTPLVQCLASPFHSMTQEEFARFAKSLSPEALAENILHCHEQVARSLWEAAEPLKRGIEWAFGAGRFLLWIKKKVLKHGEFEQWVRENCPFDKRQAQRYMRLVKKWPEIQAKATSEDAFPKSIKGLLEVVAKEDRKNTSEPDAQPKVKEVESPPDGDRLDEPEVPPKRRTGAIKGTQTVSDAPEKTYGDREQEETTENPPAPSTETADCTAQVSGKRAFFLRPEPDYDVASVIHLLQCGEARINDNFVLLGDDEIAWLEIKEDDLAYSDFRIGVGDQPQSEISVSAAEPVVNPATPSVSLAFDPHFDLLPIAECPPEQHSEHSATER